MANLVQTKLINYFLLIGYELSNIDSSNFQLCNAMKRKNNPKKATTFLALLYIFEYRI